jgi:hypothetical protein
MTLTTDKLRSAFALLLPPDLGKPYIMSTYTPPFVCVAFYPSQVHELVELIDQQAVEDYTLNGNEFVLCDYGSGSGFKKRKTLHGIIGFDEKNLRVVCHALKNLGTSKRQLKPYAIMLFEMLAQASQQDSVSSQP